MNRCGKFVSPVLLVCLLVCLLVDSFLFRCHSCKSCDVLVAKRLDNLAETVSLLVLRLGYDVLKGMMESLLDPLWRRGRYTVRLKDLPPYLVASNRKEVVPTGHPELRICLKLSIIPGFQHNAMTSVVI